MREIAGVTFCPSDFSYFLCAGAWLIRIAVAYRNPCRARRKGCHCCTQSGCDKTQLTAGVANYRLLNALEGPEEYHRQVTPLSAGRRSESKHRRQDQRVHQHADYACSE